MNQLRHGEIEPAAIPTRLEADVEHKLDWNQPHNVSDMTWRPRLAGDETERGEVAHRKADLWSVVGFL